MIHRAQPRDLGGTVASSARWALANTPAIATQAFGLATPKSAPAASEEGVRDRGLRRERRRGRDVIGSQRYAAEIQIRTELVAGAVRSVAVVPVATATRTSRRADDDPDQVRE